ncbi:hypothetical protein [Vibrio gallaecicus]|nr:hypothetical protein [Vibrio gallaecicus]MDN3615028.1 hypothetical protein [Vibrio gallaecicus]
MTELLCHRPNWYCAVTRIAIDNAVVCYQVFREPSPFIGDY